MPSIIWDWNGTLLNDLKLCISSINVLLKNRGLKPINRNTYKEVFSFPVKDYYAAAGFDFSKEDFDVPASEFIALYNKQVSRCSLHPFVHEILIHFKNRRIRQFVLSAMKENMLEETLRMNNLLDYFEGIAGLNNHYAVSKIERGEQLISNYNINKNETLIIGDTIHDFEVAEKLGIRCVLVADGHQSKSRLQSTGAVVIDNLSELISIIK